VSELRVLRVSYDQSADAGYIHMQPADVIQPSVVRTEPVGDSIVLDFDDKDRLVGVEFLSASALHPALLAEAGFTP
jgi:uncharacterized protein YuzE